MANATFKGLIYLTINGTRYKTRGTFSENPSRYSSESITNTDGSVDKMLTPRPYRLTVESVVDDGSIDWDGLMTADGINATVIEETNGRQLMLSNGFVVGDIERNVSEGTVGNFEFHAEGRAVTGV